MNYNMYKKSRDASWDILTKYKINKLPVDIAEICIKERINLISYSRGKTVVNNIKGIDVTENDGFAFIARGKIYIFYDDKCSIQRQRFTIAHEFGHYLNGDLKENIPTRRNKEPKDNDDSIETNANIVASRILSPACALWGLKVKSPKEIQSYCDISQLSAIWRWKRLQELYLREFDFLINRGHSCFLQSEQEKMLFKQFIEYISENIRNPVIF